MAGLYSSRESILEKLLDAPEAKLDTSSGREISEILDHDERTTSERGDISSSWQVASGINIRNQLII